MSSRLLMRVHDDFDNIQCQVHKVDIYFNAMFNIFMVLQSMFFFVTKILTQNPLKEMFMIKGWV